MSLQIVFFSLKIVLNLVILLSFWFSCQIVIRYLGIFCGSVWFAKIYVRDRTVHDSTRPNSTRQVFKVLNKFCVVRCLVDKMLFWYFRHFVHKQKVVPWFSGGQKFQFLSYSLASNLSNTMNSFKIKHSTTKVVMCSPYFLADQTHSVFLILQADSNVLSG
jgi:hypothetical protein